MYILEKQLEVITLFKLHSYNYILTILFYIKFKSESNF